MKLQPECIGCIIGQAGRVAQKIGASSSLTQKIERAAHKHSQNFSFSQTPPEAATPMYEELALIAQKEDLYGEAKKVATQQAKEMLPKLRQMINGAEDTLLAAAKMAVAGNVIDLAAEVDYDLTEIVDKVLHTQFGRDDFKQLFAELQKAGTLLYLADNAGEHIFDALFMEKLNELYPKLQITYMTRGNPIINDVTLQEALDDGLDRYAEVKSSGMRTPGFILADAADDIAQAFLNADIVIAKGMGNFETMTEISQRTVYHLFKVKCQVVSSYVGEPIGTFMALKRSADA